MNFNLLNKIALSVLFGIIIILSSCTPEDDVEIIETEEPLEVGFKIVVDGTEIETDAVAAYCQNDTMEFIIIANKQENLSFPMQTQNFEADDFVYFTSISDESSWSFGGQALGEDVTGIPDMLYIVFTNADIDIKTNDGEIVTGSSTGILLITLDPLDPEGTYVEYPYSMDFVAEIVQESDFCE